MVKLMFVGVVFATLLGYSCTVKAWGGKKNDVRALSCMLVVVALPNLSDVVALLSRCCGIVSGLRRLRGLEVVS